MKLSSIWKISNLGWDRIWYQTSFKELNFGNSSQKRHAKLVIEHFSFSVQFHEFSLFCFNYFAWACGFLESFPWVLFISLMHPVNDAEFFLVYCFYLLLVLHHLFHTQQLLQFPLQVYTHHCSPKRFDFSIVVLNLIWIFVLYAPRNHSPQSSFLFWVLIVTSTLWSSLCNLVCNLISNQITCCFCYFLKRPLCYSLEDIGCLHFCYVKKVFPILTDHAFVCVFTYNFLQKIRNHNLWHIFDPWARLNISLYTYHIAKFILSSISKSLEFWSVNHTSMYEDS